MLIRAYMRDWVALFFGFFFPLIFMSLFGVLNFGSFGHVSLGVADEAGNADSAQLVAAFSKIETLQVHKGSRGDELAAMDKGDRDIVLVIPSDFRIAPVRLLQGTAQLAGRLHGGACARAPHHPGPAGRRAHRRRGAAVQGPDRGEHGRPITAHRARQRAVPLPRLRDERLRHDRAAGTRRYAARDAAADVPVGSLFLARRRAKLPEADLGLPAAHVPERRAASGRDRGSLAG